MHRGIVILLLGVVALASIAAGCGGEEKPLTKAEFKKQAETTCRQAEKKRADAVEAAFEREAKAGAEPTEAVQETLIIHDALPPVLTMIEELEDLRPPESDQKQVQAIINAYQQATAEVQLNPKRALTETRQMFSKAHKLGREYGFDYCAKA
ncbi:MAG: hypothetical protein JJE35_04860 [Thermoleophilia bacterium]|nr:hypothetical protein [Thermoleophilia bacterium]